MNISNNDAAITSIYPLSMKGVINQKGWIKYRPKEYSRKNKQAFFDSFIFKVNIPSKKNLLNGIRDRYILWSLAQPFFFIKKNSRKSSIKKNKLRNKLVL